MVFFEESGKEALKSGVIGFEINLVAKSLPASPAFRDFVLPFKSQCGPIETAFSFSLISKIAHPLGLYVWCHGHIEGERLTRFILSLQRKPKSTPSSNLIQISDRLGGYPSGLSRLWPTMAEQQAEYRAEFTGMITEPRRWRLKIKRSKLPKKVAAFTLDQEEIHLQNPREKTDVLVTFFSAQSEYLLQIKSVLDLKLDEACFESASEQLWRKANSLFINK